VEAMWQTQWKQSKSKARRRSGPIDVVIVELPF
jgi:hypothetical protein